MSEWLKTEIKKKFEQTIKKSKTDYHLITFLFDDVLALLDDVVVMEKKTVQHLKPDLPYLIACSSRAKAQNRDYLAGFNRGFEQCKEKLLGLEKPQLFLEKQEKPFVEGEVRLICPKCNTRAPNLISKGCPKCGFKPPTIKKEDAER